MVCLRYILTINFNTNLFANRSAVTKSFYENFQSSYRKLFVSLVFRPLLFAYFIWTTAFVVCKFPGQSVSSTKPSLWVAFGSSNSFFSAFITVFLRNRSRKNFFLLFQFSKSFKKICFFFYFEFFTFIGNLKRYLTTSYSLQFTVYICSATYFDICKK